MGSVFLGGWGGGAYRGEVVGSEARDTGDQITKGLVSLEAQHLPNFQQGSGIPSSQGGRKRPGEIQQTNSPSTELSA